MKIVISLVVGLTIAALSGMAIAEGLSREQGDAILSELRQIRQLLDKQQKPATPPAAPAPPEKVRLKLGKEFALGRSDAPLVMVEYTDYQCPFCNRFYTTTFVELKKQYIDTGKMRFISRDLPLEFHQHSMKAAEATRCAGEQDKFWQMKDSLMINYARVTPELIASLAKELKLETTRFQACMDSGKYVPAIKEGMTAASAIGINGTPSFLLGKVTGEYLDGYVIVGAQSYAAFDAKAKELLAGAERK